MYCLYCVTRVVVIQLDKLTLPTTTLRDCNRTKRKVLVSRYDLSGAFVRDFGRIPLPYCTSDSCHFPSQPPSTHNRICTRPPPRHLRLTPMKMKERRSGVKYVKVLKVAGSVRNGKSDASGHHPPSPNVVTACDARQIVLVRSFQMSRMRKREEMLG